MYIIWFVQIFVLVFVEVVGWDSRDSRYSRNSHYRYYSLYSFYSFYSGYIGYPGYKTVPPPNRLTVKTASLTPYYASR